MGRNDDGSLQQSTDPRGLVARAEQDAAGRTATTIANRVDDAPSSLIADDDQILRFVSVSERRTRHWVKAPPCEHRRCGDGEDPTTKHGSRRATTAWPWRPALATRGSARACCSGRRRIPTPPAARTWSPTPTTPNGGRAAGDLAEGPKPAPSTRATTTPQAGARSAGRRGDPVPPASCEPARWAAIRARGAHFLYSPRNQPPPRRSVDSSPRRSLR